MLSRAVPCRKCVCGFTLTSCFDISRFLSYASRRAFWARTSFEIHACEIEKLRTLPFTLEKPLGHVGMGMSTPSGMVAASDEQIHLSGGPESEMLQNA